MAKILCCGDIIPGCTFVAKGKTPEEAFLCASEHVRLKHKLRGMSPEVIAVIHGTIADDTSDHGSRDKSREAASDDSC